MQLWTQHNSKPWSHWMMTWLQSILSSDGSLGCHEGCTQDNDNANKIMEILNVDFDANNDCL